MAGSTPEVAFYKAPTAKKGRQGAKIYPSSRGNALARFLGGSGLPRPENVAAMNAAAAAAKTAAGH